MAVYSEAIDQIMHCDTAFNNYHSDLYLGGKKVFYNKKLTATFLNADGEEVTVAPDDVQQQLFYVDTTDDPDHPQQITEYNPLLRADENSKAVQDALDYYSFKIGLGTHFYKFQNGNVTTATEYVGGKQDMVQHANKHQIEIESALITIIRAILWAGRNVCGEDVNPEASITVTVIGTR